jgi:hypothetical protein
MLAFGQRERRSTERNLDWGELFEVAGRMSARRGRA